MRVTNSFPMTGRMLRIACGMMMRTIDSHFEKPSDIAPSSCPFGMDWIPERTISHSYAPEFRISARTPAESLSKSTPMIWKLGKWMPRNGNPKNTREICTKTGVPRMTST